MKIGQGIIGVNAPANDNADEITDADIDVSAFRPLEAPSRIDVTMIDGRELTYVHESLYREVQADCDVETGRAERWKGKCLEARNLASRAELRRDAVTSIAAFLVMAAFVFGYLVGGS